MNPHKRELIGKAKLVVRPSALSNLSEVVAGRFRQCNPLISCHQRRLQGVSKKECLTRRFPGDRFLGRNRPPGRIEVIEELFGNVKA